MNIYVLTRDSPSLLRPPVFTSPPLRTAERSTGCDEKKPFYVIPCPQKSWSPLYVGMSVTIFFFLFFSWWIYVKVLGVEADKQSGWWRNSVCCVKQKLEVLEVSSWQTTINGKADIILSSRLLFVQSALSQHLTLTVLCTVGIYLVRFINYQLITLTFISISIVDSRWSYEVWVNPKPKNKQHPSSEISASLHITWVNSERSLMYEYIE